MKPTAEIIIYVGAQARREHLTRGYSLDRQRFEQNAAELEAALALVKKAAAGEALAAEQGRGLVDVIARYTQTPLAATLRRGLAHRPSRQSGRGVAHSAVGARGDRAAQGRSDGARGSVRPVRARARRRLRRHPGIENMLALPPAGGG